MLRTHSGVFRAGQNDVTSQAALPDGASSLDVRRPTTRSSTSAHGLSHGPLMALDPGAPPDLQAAARDLTGLEGFLHPETVANMALVLLIALGLGAIIAYHPSTRRKATRLPELEQPKTIVLYAMVAAVVAQIVAAVPAMALVVFGIGGLLRFRTDVGEAKDTGRVILVTVIGLSSGLRLYVVAVLATLIGFIVIALLERQTAGRIRVRGLSESALVPSAEAYRAVLEGLGCSVIRERKNVAKSQVSLVFRAPSHVNRDDVEAAIDAVPDEARGTPDVELA